MTQTDPIVVHKTGSGLWPYNRYTPQWVFATTRALNCWPQAYHCVHTPTERLASAWPFIRGLSISHFNSCFITWPSIRKICIPSHSNLALMPQSKVEHGWELTAERYKMSCADFTSMRNIQWLSKKNSTFWRVYYICECACVWMHLPKCLRTGHTFNMNMFWISF